MSVVLPVSSAQASAGSTSSGGEALAYLLEARCSIPVDEMGGPGPTPHQLRRMLTIAARVPDHGGLVPWRFLLVEGEARHRLAARLSEACTTAALVDDTEESVTQASKIVQKLRLVFTQPPILVLVVMRPNPQADILVWEQQLSAGAVCMNLITAATALGFGANWLTGWPASHPAARPVLGLEATESLAGIIPIGTPRPTLTPSERVRPALDQIVSSWREGG